jgi:5-methylthioadenosine/S-adenosylhomocysteine deaminase
MLIYSAKWVVPMDGPAIEDAEVVVNGSFIEDVRPIQTPLGERRHLGNAVLLPGLINAHTHLEYTALRGFLEDVSFFPWIRTLNASKAHLTGEDWITSAKLGALECIKSGITTIGDNTDSGAALDAAVWSGLRGRIYQEFFCIDHRTNPAEVVESLVAKLEALTARTNERLSIGISPHATYTINQAMFKAIREDTRLQQRPISIHVAESPAESDLIMHGTGSFAEMFDRRQIVWQSPGVSPTRYVNDQGVMGPQTLLIHCVHQSVEDIALVAKTGSAIIHCPKSNAKLGAGIAPLAEWLKQRDLLLGIGTDSAVSNNSHDLFEEMRFALLLQRAQVGWASPPSSTVEDITALNVLEMATSRGAKALGLHSIIGSLTVGKKADMIAVSLDGLHTTPTIDPINTLVYSARASDVILTIIDGRVCYADGDFIGIDALATQAAASEIIKKLAMVGN